METHLAKFIRATPEGDEAEAILRACVHCGFCTATCPTYQLLGDERDGPRGRIYLIKQMLEGGAVTEKTRLHLDRCLSCRACETTCPSGVNYHRLLDIGRQVLAERLPRPATTAAVRGALGATLSRPGVFHVALGVGQRLRSVLPVALAERIPDPQAATAWPAPRHARQMLVLDGCVQPALAPSINAAAAQLLDAVGISFIRTASAGCCGAVRFHLDDQAGARRDLRRLIDAWWPGVVDGSEAIVVTASGCGTHLREAAHLLSDDPHYADKAARITALVRDPAEIVGVHADALLPLLRPLREPVAVAFHSPCSLQHGLRICGVVEALLQRAGYRLTAVADGHLCCGSAGTYALLQPDLANRLRANKLAALNSGKPAIIATANIGCLTHLQAATTTPVRHWVELLAARLR